VSTGVCIRSDSWKLVASRLRPTLSSVVERHALELGIDSRDLEKQMLLHLPRFTPDELGEVDRLCDEALRLGVKLSSSRAEFSGWWNQLRIPFLEKDKVEARECDAQVAQEVYRRFHYIGSVREAVAHVGLFDSAVPDVPFAIAALSRMDIIELQQSLPRSDATLVLSRVFAFNWAPKNSISYLLGSVNKWVRRNAPEVCQLITYLNPNLGFAGSSYMASNWHLLLETPLQYLYFDGNYITYRAFQRLEESDRGRVQKSLYQLAPLRVLKYSVGEKG
jgi:hypothetical protein